MQTSYRTASQDGDDCDDECVDDEARNTQRPWWEAGPLQRIATVTRPGGLRAIGIAQYQQSMPQERRERPQLALTAGANFFAAPY